MTPYSYERRRTVRATASRMTKTPDNNRGKTDGQKPTARTYSPKTLKTLFALCGNKCAEPTCTERVIRPAQDGADVQIVGKIAHIHASSDTGPRGLAGLTSKRRDHPSNLIILCPIHHDEVDAQHQRFPAETLFAWKAAQEAKVSRDLTRSISDIGHAELEVAAQAVATASASGVAADYRVVPPTDKMEKNGLGPHSAGLLTMGAAKAHEVEVVLSNAAQLNPDFPARMTAGFVAHYKASKADGLAGDELFMEMYAWAGGVLEDEVRRAAGLCILAHLFILCDVFEK